MDLPTAVYSSKAQANDVEIIEKVTGGDTDAFAVLLERYKNHVARIVGRHVPYEAVDETAHNVFIRAYKSLPTYSGEGNFKQWLSSVAVRTCHDFWRERYRSRELPASSLSEEHMEWLENTMAHDSDQAFRRMSDQREAKELLDWALDKLSASDRMVVELVYLEELPIKEAAELLGWSATNVKVRLFRTRRKLYKLLSDFMKKREGKNDELY